MRDLLIVPGFLFGVAVPGRMVAICAAHMVDSLTSVPKLLLIELQNAMYQQSLAQNQSRPM